MRSLWQDKNYLQNATSFLKFWHSWKGKYIFKCWKFEVYRSKGCKVTSHQTLKWFDPGPTRIKKSTIPGFTELKMAYYLSLLSLGWRLLEIIQSVSSSRWNTHYLQYLYATTFGTVKPLLILPNLHNGKWKLGSKMSSQNYFTLKYPLILTKINQNI